MLLCSCRAVSEQRIRDVIEGGARSPGEIALACGAATDCGGCWPALTELLEEHEAAKTKGPRTRAHTAA